MHKFLLVTFDLIRRSEPGTSLASGYLLSYLKSQKKILPPFEIQHLSYNLLSNKKVNAEEVVSSIIQTYPVSEIDGIALSCYIWSEYLINPVIHGLRKRGYKNRIILGGNQISQDDRTASLYKGADVFILGYAETALVEAFFDEQVQSPWVLVREINMNDLPSPFLTNEIFVKNRQSRVRIETKRGCPHNCSFCGHRDLHNHKVHHHPIEQVYEELLFLKSKSVMKINIIDPLFNVGDDYLRILEYCKRINIESLITLQVGFNHIRGNKGQQFLELCSDLNVQLEFGLQSTIEKELKAINRTEDPENINSVIVKLKQLKIPYSINLIFGLPEQTLDSFISSVNFLLESGCNNIVAFPLMLLPETQLFREKDIWKLGEEQNDYLYMPFVTNSYTFSREDWELMKKISGSLRRKFKVQ